MMPGGKTGTLRFLGDTEFANGVWGGIELDQPQGKNDGSVQVSPDADLDEAIFRGNDISCASPFSEYLYRPKTFKRHLCNCPAKARSTTTRLRFCERSWGRRRSRVAGNR